MTNIINYSIHTISPTGLVSNTITNIQLGYALNSKTYTPFVSHHTTYIKVPTPTKQTPTNTRLYLARFNPTIQLSNGASSAIGYVIPFNSSMFKEDVTTNKDGDNRSKLGIHLTTNATPKIRDNKDGSIGDIYYSSSWANAITLKARINLRDMLPTVKHTRWFRLQLLLTRNKDKAIKRQIRRDIARSKNSITKTNKVIQPSRQKRSKVVLPSSK